MKTSTQVDAYIAKAQPFARPVLQHLRMLVHRACPEVTETIKWGFPFFEYKGPMCFMSAFKQHVAFGFWKAALLNDPKKYLKKRSNQGGNGMGHLGRIELLQHLPPDEVITDFVVQAMKLNEAGVKLPPKKKKQPVQLPYDFTQALKKNKQALQVFKNFTAAQQREYVEWLTEAKTEATRSRRLEQAITWIAEGKQRNWKYMKK